MIPPVLVWVTIAMMKTPKASWGGKGLLTYSSTSIVHHGRKSRQELKQGRNLEAGVDAEAMEGCCLVACSSWLSQSAFLQNPGPPAQGLQCVGPSPINH